MVKRFLNLLLIAGLSILTFYKLQATHNRAGEITYRQIGPLTIEMTITTYTKASSVAADRDSLEVEWGDGTKEFVKRNNNLTRFESNDVKVNFYIREHTYPGVATYTISFLDPNRIGGILNVNYPNSIDIPFFLSTTFTLLDQQFQGYNNSAVLLQPPLDIGCVGRLFIHNPNAYDADGDSLAYELAVPLEDINKAVPGYRYPNEIVPGPDNTLSINPLTGEIRWQSPKLQGEYNIAIRIKEYRNGRLINTILRDMQILIRACENRPPSIESIDEICIIAGERLEIPITVNDPDIGQKVKLFATGGPFAVDRPAIIEGPLFYTAVPFQAKLIWETNCNHISNQYYQVVLRAVDNFYPDSTGLAFLKSIRIKVVGPAPQNLTAKSENASVKLEWDTPYTCEETERSYFRGFSVWRKIAGQALLYDTCNPGLSGSPYTKIVFRTNQQVNGKYFFIDNTAEKGNTYCYRVQAEFARLTLTNNPFNLVESLHSNESCIQLSRDLPLITKVSVTNTDAGSGSIHIRWTKPFAGDLDTLINNGPYRFELYRTENTGDYQLIPDATVNADFLGSIVDTNYVDSGLNTLSNQYLYKIRFYTSAGLYGDSPAASSLFLNSEPSDKQVRLNWNANVPWANYSYAIYRQEENGISELLQRTSDTKYTDTDLENEKLYCYVIESTGSYSLDNIEDPLINDSQITCVRPTDNVPPCPPVISVSNICDQLTGSNPDSQGLFNTIIWNNPVANCPELAKDLSTFNIYFAETVNDEPEYITSVPVSGERKYFHFPSLGLSGCYWITAVDSSGNEGQKSNRVCVDNCPFYVLPNTFTPNSDGKNDTFKPRINLFIASVEFKVYNQWGNLVFETSNPSLDWNGTTNKGTSLADGTYYYTCRVFESRVTGIVESPNILSGFIHIIRK